MENDDVKANDEVNNISQIITHPDYLVIPIHGCSTNIFRTIFDSFSSIDILHIAGHTAISNNRTLLQFVDSNMTFTKFNEIIQYHQFYLAFLNCCSTLEFANNTNIPNALNCVLHNDKVTNTHAYDFSDHFFTTFNTTNDVSSSWHCAFQNSNETPFNYRLF
ncbi:MULTISPECIES: hypothetical protein [Lactococcus]|uniref:hypothetical protein n=1 Tax=Lactococcus TaxID=1357 RepID=UPI001BEDBE57|nr:MULTISPECIES: hypothetical protein [Lactococcus]QUW40295.1 hypothetical protein [Lactococcus garvieae]